jgi:hypothetical protein
VVLTNFANVGIGFMLGDLIRATCNGRVTTESGVPISTTDRVAQGTLHFTPDLGNQIALYDGSSWALYTFAEISFALSGLVSDKLYDVFLYNNAGVLTLELSAAWASDSARTDAIALQDGIPVKSGAPTRRHVGTIRATGTATTEDSFTKRFVYNVYNQVERRLYKTDATSHTYNGAYRQWNNAAANKIEWICGVIGAAIDVHILGEQITASGTFQYPIVAAGLDTTTSSTFPFIFCYIAGSNDGVPGASGGGSGTFLPGLGYHYVAAMESGIGTQTFTSFQLSARVLL